MAKSLVFSLLLASLAHAWGPDGFGDNDCTSTITTSPDLATAPVHRYSATLTYVSYATVLTTHVPVDCGGCTALATQTKTDIPGPSRVFEPSTRWIIALEPAYVTEPYCKPTPGTGMTIPPFAQAQEEAEAELKIRGQELPQKKNQVDGVPVAPCLSVLFIPPDFTAGPTRTVWTTTTTQTSTVDCGLCEDVIPMFIPLGIPPVVLFNATTTVSTPSVTTEYECSATPVPPTTLETAIHPSNKRRDSPFPSISPGGTTSEEKSPITYFQPDFPEQEFPTTATPAGVDKPECTTSTALPAVIADSTWTFFPTTVTSTSTIDCGECALEWSTGVIYYFAPIVYTSTTTVTTPSVKVDLACSAVPTDE